MQLKGFKQFRKKLPGFKGNRIILIPAVGLFSFALSCFILLLVYWIPHLFPQISFFQRIEPILPVFGQVAVSSTGFYLISRVWNQRHHLLEQSRELAYQRGAIQGFIGIPFVIAIAVHNLFPIPLFWQFTNSTTSLLFYSPFRSNLILSFIFSLMGFVLLLMSLLTIRRALLTFGLDYMAVVYLYYPEESELQNHQIYSVLRHPTYFAVILTALGTGLIRFSAYSLLSVLLVITGIFIHITFIEEKELLDRFESYQEYKRQVPAFIIRPNQILPFLRFIFSK
jgi:protein-S-isoprenylcysteine O-methyltransferase Ste14